MRREGRKPPRDPQTSEVDGQPSDLPRSTVSHPPVVGVCLEPGMARQHPFREKSATAKSRQVQQFDESSSGQPQTTHASSDPAVRGHSLAQS
jgi:hypothetical protein